jgi:hypothetical protein
LAVVEVQLVKQLTPAWVGERLENFIHT